MSSRSEKASQLRAVLQKYQGGRFETGSSGGASGMVFFVREGDRIYIGGFNRDHAESLVRALNLTMELLESR